MNLVDLHSHILPGVDDGASHLEMAVEMMRMAHRDGIRKMASTPHRFSVCSRMDSPGDLENRFLRLQRAVEEEGIEVKLYRGAEVFFDASLMERLDDPDEKLTINGSRYFLLEFPMDFLAPGAHRFLAGVVRSGRIPILCHPERHLEIQKNPSILFPFLQAGCLVQVNGGSLKGDFGSEAARAASYLLKQRWVHILASDAHNNAQRPPRLSYLYDLPLGLKREEVDSLIQHNPTAVLEDESMDYPVEYRPPRFSRSLFSFLNSRKKEWNRE